MPTAPVVQAADGYRVVFSQPDITDHVVLLADRNDGKPLDAKEGPYRLVVPHDKRHMLLVRQVTKVVTFRRSTRSGSDKKGKDRDKPPPSPER